MANIHKVSKPSATTVTEIFECAKDNTVISCISVCNTSTTTEDSYSIRIVPDWETRWDQHKIASTNDISFDDSKYIMISITPRVWTKIYIESTNWSISFNLFWQEWA